MIEAFLWKCSLFLEQRIESNANEYGPVKESLISHGLSEPVCFRLQAHRYCSSCHTIDSLVEESAMKASVCHIVINEKRYLEANWEEEHENAGTY